MVSNFLSIYIATKQPEPPSKEHQRDVGGVITLLVTVASSLLSNRKQEQEPQKVNIEVGVSNTPNSSPAPDNSADNAPNYNWVNQVLKLPFRIISGEQGSGKSTLERFMIAKLKDAGYSVVCINPETNPDVWQGVTVLSNPDDITNYLKHFPQMVRQRQQDARDKGIDEDDYLDVVRTKKAFEGRPSQNTTIPGLSHWKDDGLIAIFFMETNTYEVHGVNPDVWADALKQCLTNIRKWGFTACFTAHSDNQTSVASKLKGFSKLLDSQPRIDCISQPHPQTGEAVSSGKGLLKMKGINDKNPVEIDLYNYPKTKDFRTDDERDYERTIKANNSDTNVDLIENNDNQIINIADDLQRTEYSSYEALALKVYDSCKGIGKLKVSRLPTKCYAIKKHIVLKFGKQDLDRPQQVQELHIILGILEYQSKAKLFAHKDELGSLVRT